MEDEGTGNAKLLEDVRNMYRIVIGKLERNDNLGGSSCSCERNIKMGLKKQAVEK
jgi:hypothetical protein